MDIAVRPSSYAAKRFVVGFEYLAESDQHRSFHLGYVLGHICNVDPIVDQRLADIAHLVLLSDAETKLPVLSVPKARIKAAYVIESLAADHYRTSTGVYYLSFKQHMSVCDPSLGSVQLQIQRLARCAVELLHSAIYQPYLRIAEPGNLLRDL